MKSIVITGCNRGIGLGLVRNLAKRENRPRHIITTCRDLQKAKELETISKENENVHILELDVRNFDSHEKFVTSVSNIVKDDGLNVLFNNAGVSPKFSRIQLAKADHIIETFITNTVAPIMLVKAFLPLLNQASQKNADLPFGTSRAAIINMSSMLGSVEMNTDGGLYPYRCSKAALNMATVSMSLDLKKDKILATAFHPGWVKTDMGGSKAPLDVDSSSSSLVDFLYTLNESHNGGLYQWDGKKLPW